MTSLPPIFFLTPDPLTALWQDKPQIARRLARTYPVLYASEEPYLRPLLHELRQGLVPALHPPALTHVVDGLYHFHWSPLTPVTGAPILGALTAALRLRRLQSALRQIPSTVNRLPFTINHSPRPILWLFRPGMAHWIHALHPQLVIYHVVDDYSAYPNLTSDQAARQRELDRQLCARADLVFCTAQSLVAARRPLNPHTYYLPNAVDYEAFQSALIRAHGLDAAQTPTRPAREAAALIGNHPGGTRPTHECTNLPIYPSPLLGFVGGINAKVDLVLLAEVAERRPDWTVALVGPLGYGLDAAEVARLRALSNVHFTGPVPPEEVPAAIAACDVCLIPYKLTEQTRHVNPLKVYEYLAVGKPVAGTALPELMQFGEMVKVSGGEVSSAKWQVADGEVSSARCQVSGGEVASVRHQVSGVGCQVSSSESAVVGDAGAETTDVESFIACVEAALAEAGDPERVSARKAIAAANTWDHRVARMLALIEEALARREPVNGER